MKAIILAAGYATRLYPLTLDKPKALLLIKDKAVVEYTLRKIGDIKEIDEVFIVTNDKFYDIVNRWVKNNNEKFKFSLKVINDLTNSNEERLGGIGDLWFCVEKSNINEDILILNSDNLFDFSLKDAFDFFQRKKGIVNGIYLVENKEETKKHGVVELLNDKIISFEEKPIEPKTNFTSIGVYFFPEIILPKIKEYLEQGNNKDAPGNLIKYFLERFNVYGYLFKGKLFDIGNIESYNDANKVWKG
ncbi:nucleotidyltransferase family protein [Candidatus Pacearchaeota archaeon]|nr:nucleotidyltransferase family protein [Candidatus Pacearchaeota archaeon]